MVKIARLLVDQHKKCQTPTQKLQKRNEKKKKRLKHIPLTKTPSREHSPDAFFCIASAYASISQGLPKEVCQTSKLFCG
jgi:hypothetical protein